jgi:hypothetical protein
MASLRQLVCRHRYEPVERIEDGAGEKRLETHELRCAKCGKTRFVTRGERDAVGQGDLRFGSVRRRS